MIILTRIAYLSVLGFVSLLGVAVAGSPLAAQDWGKALGRPAQITSDFGALDFAWSPDGRRIVGVVGQRLLSYNLAESRVEWSNRYDHIASRHVAFFDQGRFILAPALETGNYGKPLNSDAVFSIIDARTGRIVRIIRTDVNAGGETPRQKLSAGERFDISPDGRIAIAQPGDSRLIVAFDTATGRELWRVGPMVNNIHGPDVLDLQRGRVTSMSWMAEAWDITSNRQLSNFKPYQHSRTLTRAILDPRTGNIITGSMIGGIPGRPDDLSLVDDPEKLVRAWNPVDGAIVRIYPGPGRSVDALALSPDGRYLFAVKARGSGKDAHVVAWEASSGRMIAASSYGQALLGGLAISPDGRRLAVSAADVLQIIELDTQLFH